MRAVIDLPVARFVGLLLVAGLASACVDPAMLWEEPPSSTGRDGAGGGAGGGSGTDGGPGDLLDASGLEVELDAHGRLCRMSPDGRALLVRVHNAGRAAAPAVDVAVRAAGAEQPVVALARSLGPDERADVVFDRGALLGFADPFRFTVTLDPDGRFDLGAAPLEGVCEGPRSRATEAMAVLDGWFDDAGGTWAGIGWWRGANALTTLVDYAREMGDATYVDRIDAVFEAQKGGGFLNEYYDDEGWWALAWIDAYDLTHQTKYLDMAKSIFTDMTGGWDPDHCGGGLYWRKTDATKNAIPNELFLTVAARLHLRTPDDAGAGSYLDWAERAWAWFEASGMLGEDHHVVDGMNSDTCASGGPIYTYNQGVILGGLVDLHRSTGDASLLDTAEAIARAAIEHMTDDDGVLVETSCHPTCGGDDGVQFKGILARNLAYLNDARPMPELAAFFRTQSDALHDLARDDQGAYGRVWTGPFDSADAARQSSALDAFVGAVRTGNPNLALRATATGSPACATTETPDRAADGTTGFGSKWCSGGAGGQVLDLDLGARREIVGFRVAHAGAGGEDPGWNTRDFEILVSEDGATFAPVVTVTGNTDDVTEHPIVSTFARYVRLHVTSAQTRTDFAATRVYEVEVIGTGI